MTYVCGPMGSSVKSYWPNIAYVSWKTAFIIPRRRVFFQPFHTLNWIDECMVLLITGFHISTLTRPPSGFTHKPVATLPPPVLHPPSFPPPLLPWAPAPPPSSPFVPSWPFWISLTPLRVVRTQSVNPPHLPYPTHLTHPTPTLQQTPTLVLLLLCTTVSHKHTAAAWERISWCYSILPNRGIARVVFWV